MNIIEKAKIFATAAHAAIGQKRKYTGEDYIVHPAEVATIVMSVPGRTDEMVAAAWLHDTVEDTEITILKIRDNFGEKVALLVAWLTDVSNLEDGNRAVRKEIDRRHTFCASAEAKTVKLADLISNTKSITEYDPNFAKVYMREKEALLNVLHEGDFNLWTQASRQIRDFKASILDIPQKERLE